MAGMSNITEQVRSLWYGRPAAEIERQEKMPRRRRWLLAAISAAVVVVVAMTALLVRAADQRAEDRRIDGYYCVQPGVGPSDRGTNTGDLCADLLD